MNTLRRRLSHNERLTLQKVLRGEADAGAKKHQVVLQRPHVAITFESMLDSVNLSDNALAQKLSEIVSREAVINDKGTSNQTSVDSNVLGAITMIFKIRGKFIEHEKTGAIGELSKMSDDQLDKFIGEGQTYLHDKLRA